ncbi:MAG: hypothetical protein V2I82_15655 [Halieaceae bacterium]|jgi:hypothetical protein|nr:hypothetical protein [Halieaceae bacterium]
MNSDSERLDRNERRNSLAAFLRAIRFRKPKTETTKVERVFAQLHSRARRPSRLADEHACIRSAN